MQVQRVSRPGVDRSSHQLSIVRRARREPAQNSPRIGARHPAQIAGTPRQPRRNVRRPAASAVSCCRCDSASRRRCWRQRRRRRNSEDLLGFRVTGHSYDVVREVHEATTRPAAQMFIMEIGPDQVWVQVQPPGGPSRRTRIAVVSLGSRARTMRTDSRGSVSLRRPGTPPPSAPGGWLSSTLRSGS